MAAQTVQLNPNTSSDALFRACVSSIDTFFTTAGWTLTADTGQIDPTTVNKPVAADTPAGFRMYRTNDGLTNVYCKAEYGSAVASANKFGMWLTYSTGTNGAGTCSGRVSTRTQISPSGAGAISSGTPNGSGEYTCLMSGSSGRMTLALFVNTDNTGACMFSHFERVPNASGTARTDLVAIVMEAATVWTVQPMWIDGVGPSIATATTLNCVSNASNTAADGSDYVTFDTRMNVPGPTSALRGIQGYHKLDLADEQTYVASVYGAAQTWKTVGHFINGVMLRATGTTCILMRYE